MSTRKRHIDGGYAIDTPFPEPLMVERGRDYERELRWRFSRLPWRRRRAAEARDKMIEIRERDLYGFWPRDPAKRSTA